MPHEYLFFSLSNRDGSIAARYFYGIRFILLFFKLIMIFCDMQDGNVLLANEE